MGSDGGHPAQDDEQGRKPGGDVRRQNHQGPPWFQNPLCFSHPTAPVEEMLQYGKTEYALEFSIAEGQLPVEVAGHHGDPLRASPLCAIAVPIDTVVAVPVEVHEPLEVREMLALACAAIEALSFLPQRCRDQFVPASIGFLHGPIVNITEIRLEISHGSHAEQSFQQTGRLLP